MILASVVSQHLEEALSLRRLRSWLVRAPQVDLDQLARADERLEAHLDGLVVAQDEGAAMVDRTLAEAPPEPGAVFVAAVLALQAHEHQRLLPVLDRVGDDAAKAREAASALGWVAAPILRGIGLELLASSRPLHRRLGLAACSLHRVDPGPALKLALDSTDAQERARGLDLAGEIGRVELLGACLRRLDDAEPACRWAAARSAVLLGDRSKGHAALCNLAQDLAHPAASRALCLALCSADAGTARHLVRKLVDGGAPLRTQLQAAGWTGDVRAVGWLVQHMTDDQHARCAGEAFSFITGIKLDEVGLQRTAPPDATLGPNEDPGDDGVALDCDEGLPWPVAEAAAASWQRRCADLHGACLLGRAIEPDHCRFVLRHGTQRQRLLAALHLKVMHPNQSLFNVAAPARRQMRLLAHIAPTDQSLPRPAAAST